MDTDTADSAAARVDTRVDAAKPRYTKGAIGAVSRSIEDLKRRSIIEVDPRMVDAAGLKDRLDSEDAGLDGLVASIREYGQQVPVLLRINPNSPERYQIVYGRRRVAAMRQLELPVKALIRELDDRALVLAQGQENTARKDLTFIEKANFARQMRDAGYERKIMCDALAMDKTLISRMLSVADRIPVPLIEAIGAAPAVGRDRWLKLADQIASTKLRADDLVAGAQGDTSDARFGAVITLLRAPRTPAPLVKAITTDDGAVLAEVTQKGAATVLRLPHKTSAGFDDWLVENLREIHRTWAETGPRGSGE